MRVKQAPLSRGEVSLIVWRRWWAPIFLVLVAASIAATVTGWLSVFSGTVAAVAVAVAFDLARTARRMPESGVERWQRGLERHVVRIWPDLVVQLGLHIRRADGGVITAGIGDASWSGLTCTIPVALPAGLGREHLLARSGLIGEALGARRTRVDGVRIDCLLLRLHYADELAEPFVLPIASAWDGRDVVMGKSEDGELWRMRLGTHTLVAGSSGSGKASLVWGLLLGLAQPIHAGVIEVHGIDRKGGMELAMGRSLLTRFASDASTSVQLLEEAVAAMQLRARQLAGSTRQHVASVGSPHVVVLIDELAALTAYETDREMLRRANAAISTLASQGRAVGYTVFACLQDPRKETLPSRGLFTQTVALRLRDKVETAMVLGDGAVLDGALCHEIPTTTPGVAYVHREEGGPPVRVRAGNVSDEQIREAAARFPAPRQLPIVAPDPQPRTARPTSAARPRRDNRKEAPE